MSLPEYLSLGVGVQSSTLAFMADEGEIEPMPKAGFFGDTKDEPAKVYEWWQYLKANIRNFPIFAGSYGDLMQDSLRVRRSSNCANCKHRHPKSQKCHRCDCAEYLPGRLYLANSIPAYVKTPDGSKGILDRKCTRDYKIAVVHRGIKKHLGLKRIPANSPILATVWVGISFDEEDRQSPSKVPWIENRWPLLERGMTREDCVQWMLEHKKPKPPRSACKKCPYHSDATWLAMKIETPEEFQECVDWEKQLQAAFQRQEVLEGMPFLHASLVPLDQVQFNPDDKRDKFNRTCEGMCGL
jgi:hypothetical protein